MQPGKAKILDAADSLPAGGGASFSLGNRMVRAAWILVWFVGASWTPRQLAGWRRTLLRLFGAKVAAGGDVRGSARVWFPPNLVLGENAVIGPGVNCYNMGLITLEAGALVSQGAHLCGGTHDIDGPRFQLRARPIVIGAQAWIAAEAFIGPGTRVGEGAVVGARCVAFGELAPWTIYSGNPARALRQRRRVAPVL